jgi:hypothetical protein
VGNVFNQLVPNPPQSSGLIPGMGYAVVCREEGG